jgi:hypothetical protein
MPKYKVAHINEQGEDMIIFPLNAKFGRISVADQNKQLRTLQVRATAAGLAGKAVAVWDSGDGRMGFLGPRQWDAFLRSLNLRYVMLILNKEVSW